MFNNNCWVFFFFLKFIYLFLVLAVLSLRFCARASSSCGERGLLFIVMCGPLTIAASLVAEHRLQTRRLSSCGSRAQLLRSMWDLPRPGLKPVSPALAGRFSTTAPPGKPLVSSFQSFGAPRNGKKHQKELWSQHHLLNTPVFPHWGEMWSSSHTDWLHIQVCVYIWICTIDLSA